jgi:lysophospholipase L1-like esterase
MGYYLVLGDSLAAGYQPAHDDLAGGVDLKRGYAHDVLAGTRRVIRRRSQLDQALEFLPPTGGTPGRSRSRSAPTTSRGAWTRATLVIDMVCIQAGMADVATYLPMILGKLRAEAPDAQVIVLNYYNPFLAAWLTGNTALAEQSAQLQATLNAIIG